MRPPSTSLAPLGPPVGFVALFALLPAAVLFAISVGALGGVGGWAGILRQPDTVLAVENSLVQGAWSAGFAVAIGYPAGVFLGRYSWPGRSAVRSFLLVPFLLPSLVVVLGVGDLFGPAGLVSSAVPPLGWFGGGVPGIVGANLLFNAPVVMLFTATGCDAAAPELEETVASLGASPGRTYLDAWAAPTWVGAGAGGLLTFLFSALSFAPPLLLCHGTRCYTVEAYVWELDQRLLAPGAAGGVALAMMALFAVPTAAYLLLLARLRAAGTRRSFRAHRVPWGSPGAVGLAVIAGGVMLAEASLLAAVLYRSLAPPRGGPLGAQWSRLFSGSTAQSLGISIGGAIGNTLFFASVATAIAVVLGICAGFAVARWPARALGLGLVLFLPVLISPVVLALALATFWRPILGGESMVWVLVIVSQATLALPFALQSVALPLARLPASTSETLRTLGATPWGAFLDGELPRAKDGLVTAGLFAFALGLGEFTATYFLVTPQFVTLPVAIYHLETSTRAGPLADAAAGLLLLLSLGVFALLSAGGRRVEL